jgi:hypothetical protein
VFCAKLCNQKGETMNISSVGPSQLYSAQQVQTLSAVSADDPADSISNASASLASNGNSLTGTTTSNLDSQTLQALLELTQQDPGSSPSQADQTGQAQNSQVEGAPRHHGHHHGGGMMQAQSGDPSLPSTTAAAGSDPSLTASVDASDETDEASLASALMNA